MLTRKQMNDLDDKIVRVADIYGDVLEGVCRFDSKDYLECEFGFDEDGLQIVDYIVLKSQIASAEAWDPEAEEGLYRGAEIERKMVFSLRMSHSEHLKRWEDNEVPDKYDHNAFEYSGQPSRDEFRLALDYQKERGDTFIKLEGREPLEDSFGLEENVVLTMALDKDPEDAPFCKDVTFGEPSYKELKDMEVSHYGSKYGEDFCVRSFDELYEFLDFRGAYLDGRLVGYYHRFNARGITLIDGLLVDREHRNKGIATALIRDAAALASEAAGGGPGVLLLHADRDDTPRELYEKLGFRAVDTLYEYLCTDISSLQI